MPTPTTCQTKFILYSGARRILMLSMILVLLAGGVADAKQGKNSTRKLRVKPSETSKKIGLGVKWQPDFAAAMTESKKTGKPIFWYVPTLPNTFMDRKVELHRYMMAGPFSWPAIVDTINQNCVPLKRRPTGAQQKKYGLNPYEFIEPGFILIRPNGEKSFSLDRVSTMHPNWLLRLIRKQLNAKGPGLYSDRTAAAWKQFSQGNYQDVVKTLGELNHSEKDSVKAEAELLQAMSFFRLGKHEVAKNMFEAMAKKFPAQPLGWKAAAEAQGIGPFVRGLEVHRAIPEGAYEAGIKSAGSASPQGQFSQKQLWIRSVDFLLGMQNVDGAFYDSDYDFGGTDSLPNVYVAVTSLAGVAMLHAQQQPHFDAAQKLKLKTATERALKYVLNDQHINKADRDEILWAYAYRLRFVAACLAEKSLKIEGVDLKKELDRCIVSLQSVQANRGSWYHEYNNPFTTATALVALYEAKQRGGKVDMAVIQKGIASLSNDRMANGAYPYSSSRPGKQKKGTKRQVAAAAGRMPLCDLALLNWQKLKQKDLVSAIERSFEYQKNLDSALKYDNHTSNLAYGGFFFWYDMRSRSEAIVSVVDSEKSKKLKKQHLALILNLPELDGCFIDSHELGRVYGTSMALISLANVSD